MEKESDLIKKIDALTHDLAISEKYTEDLFKFSPLPICFVGSNSIVLEVNSSFENIFGKGLEEIVGEHIEKFFGKENTEKFLEETAKKDFFENKRTFFNKSDGIKILIDFFSKARKNEKGEIIGYFVGFFDLTEVIRNENDLQDAKFALLNILEDTEETTRKIEDEKNKTIAVISNLKDGLIILDENNRVSLVNSSARVMFSILSGDVIGKSLLELKNFSNFKYLLDIFGPNFKEVFRKELKISESLIVEVSTTNLIKKNISSKKIKLGSLIILHDITREKIIEKMKTEFVSISAHQLRTPLSAIKWTLEMLLNGDLGKITSEQREFIEKIKISNERMITLINDLLNVSRIEEGRYIYKTVFSDLSEVVKATVSFYGDVAKRKNITMEVNNTDGKLPKIKIDEEKINLAISNLVDNAIKYTPAGGKIVIFTRRESDVIKFSIKDSGLGIPENQKERIFGKFFRAANVLKAETDGSGLGLFIVKNIIEAHGGKIWFESEDGKGATFYFILPIKDKFSEFLEKF